MPRASSGFSTPTLPPELKPRYSTFPKVRKTSLKYLENLEELNVDSQEGLLPTSLVHLAGLKKLQRLFIRFCCLGDQIMPYLGKLSELRELEMIYNDETEVGLRHLLNLKKLEKLEVDYMEDRSELIAQILRKPAK